MLAFPRFRSKFKGNINPFAYMGMLSDTVVIVGIYLLWSERKKRKALAAVENEKKQRIENL
jgi:hypothetical protein